MRIALLRMADDEHRLIWSTHHLLIDGWSWPLVFKELSVLYGAAELGPQLLERPCAYRRYVEWLAHRDADADDRFWRAALDGVAEATPVGSGAASVGSPRQDGLDEISRRTTVDIASVARAHQVTFGTIVTAAWGLVLAHHSSRSDVVFGGAFAGRPAEVAGIESMVGPCVNNLPIRVKIDEADLVADWLEKVHDQLCDLAQHQSTPLTRIRACTGVPARMRLFESLLVIQNYVIDSAVDRIGDVRLTALRCPESTNYPLTVVVRPGVRPEVKVAYLRDRFNEAAAEALADDLVTTLDALAHASRDRLGTLMVRLRPWLRGRVADPVADKKAARRPRIAPRTEMERKLADVWRGLFGADIGTDENYFELGAHSLMLMQAHERIRASIKPDLPIVALFQYPTIRDLAMHLSESQPSGRRDEEIRARALQQRLALEARKPQTRPN